MSGPVTQRSNTFIQRLLGSAWPFGPTLLDVTPGDGALLVAAGALQPNTRCYFAVEYPEQWQPLTEAGFTPAEGIGQGFFATEPYDQLPRYATIIATPHPTHPLPISMAYVTRAARWLAQEGRLVATVPQAALTARDEQAIQFQFWLAQQATQTEWLDDEHTTRLVTIDRLSLPQ